jgi:opacity protein-like surface antigen
LGIGSTAVNIKQNEAVAMAFAVNLGAGLRYNVSDKIALTINMDYFSTKPEFEVATTSNFGYSSNDDFKQTINMLNISFGIGYILK